MLKQHNIYYRQSEVDEVRAAVDSNSAREATTQVAVLGDESAHRESLLSKDFRTAPGGRVMMLEIQRDMTVRSWSAADCWSQLSIHTVA